MLTCPIPVPVPGDDDRRQPCGTTVWADTSVCGLHLRGLQHDLDDIERVTALLDDFDLLTAAGEAGVRGVPGSRPPLRVAAVITGPSRESILGWAADVVRTSRALTLAEAGRLLRLNFGVVLAHDAIVDIWLELTSAAADSRDAGQKRDGLPPQYGRSVSDVIDPPSGRQGFEVPSWDQVAPIISSQPGAS